MCARALETMTTVKRGRPSRYSEAVVARLCLGIAHGKSLRSLCREPRNPGGLDRDELARG